MAQITIDTDRDSAEAIRKIIMLLEHCIAEKGGHVVMQNSNNYSSQANAYSSTPNYNSTPTSFNNQPSSAPVSTNPFSMFDDNSTPAPTPTTTMNTQTTTQTTTPSNDMFSMFDNTTLSSSPGSYGESTTVFSQEKSAQDLLQETTDWDEDIVEEKKEDKDFFALSTY